MLPTPSWHPLLRHAAHTCTSHPIPSPPPTHQPPTHTTHPPTHPPAQLHDHVHLLLVLVRALEVHHAQRAAQARQDLDLAPNIVQVLRLLLGCGTAAAAAGAGAGARRVGACTPGSWGLHVPAAAAAAATGPHASAAARKGRTWQPVTHARGWGCRVSWTQTCRQTQCRWPAQSPSCSGGGGSGQRVGGMWSTGCERRQQRRRRRWAASPHEAEAALAQHPPPLKVGLKVSRVATVRGRGLLGRFNVPYIDARHDRDRRGLQGPLRRLGDGRSERPARGPHVLRSARLP